MAYKIETLFFALGLIIFSGRVIAASHEQNQDKPVTTRRSAARMKVARNVLPPIAPSNTQETVQPQATVQPIKIELETTEQADQVIAALDKALQDLEQQMERFHSRGKISEEPVRSKPTRKLPRLAPAIVLTQATESPVGAPTQSSQRLKQIQIGRTGSAFTKYPQHLAIPAEASRRTRRARIDSSQSSESKPPFEGTHAGAVATVSAMTGTQDARVLEDS